LRTCRSSSDPRTGPMGFRDAPDGINRLAKPAPILRHGIEHRVERGVPGRNPYSDRDPQTASPVQRSGEVSDLGAVDVGGGRGLLPDVDEALPQQRLEWIGARGALAVPALVFQVSVVEER